MKLTHVAIVGIGSIGRRHLLNLRKLRPDIKITLIRSGYGANYPELELADNIVFELKDAINTGIQAAILSSPATLHVEQGIELANAGIHLLIEKPISHSLQDVDKLIEAVSASNVVGLTGYILRYDPVARAFKDLLQDSRLGQLLHIRVEASSYLPNWRPEQNYRETVSASAERGGGVLLELSHEFDYIRWFFGEISNMTAHLHNSHHLEIEVEECADIVMNTQDSVPISLHLDFHQHHPTRFCFVAGSKGSAKWDAMNNKLIWHAAEEEEEEILFSFERDQLFKDQIIHFLDCIENGAKPLVSLNDALQTLKLVEIARKSSSTGMRIDVE